MEHGWCAGCVAGAVAIGWLLRMLWDRIMRSYDEEQPHDPPDIAW